MYCKVLNCLSQLIASSKRLQQFFRVFNFFCLNLTVHSFDILLSHSFDKWTLLWLTYTTLTPKIGPQNFPQIFSEFNFCFEIAHYFDKQSLLWHFQTVIILTYDHYFDRYLFWLKFQRNFVKTFWRWSVQKQTLCCMNCFERLLELTVKASYSDQHFCFKTKVYHMCC